MATLPARLALAVAFFLILTYSCLRQDVRRVDDVYLANAYIADLEKQISGAQISLARNLLNASGPEIRRGDPTLGVLLALEAEKSLDSAELAGDAERVEIRGSAFWLFASAQQRYQEAVTRKEAVLVTSPFFKMVSAQEGRLYIDGKLFRLSIEINDTGDAEAKIEEISIPGDAIDPQAIFLWPGGDDRLYLWELNKVGVLDFKRGEHKVDEEWQLPPGARPQDAGHGLIVSSEAIENAKRAPLFRLKVRDVNGRELQAEFNAPGGPEFRQAYVSGPGEVVAILWKDPEAGSTNGQIIFRKFAVDFESIPGRLRQLGDYSIESNDYVSIRVQNGRRMSNWSGNTFRRATLDPVTNILAFRPSRSLRVFDSAAVAVEFHDLGESKRLSLCDEESKIADTLLLKSGGRHAIWFNRYTSDLEIRGILAQGCPAVATLRGASPRRVSQVFELEPISETSQKILLTEAAGGAESKDYVLPISFEENRDVRRYDLDNEYFAGFGGHKAGIRFAAPIEATTKDGKKSTLTLTIGNDGKISIWRVPRHMLSESALSKRVTPSAPVGKAQYARMVSKEEAAVVGDDGLGVVDLRSGEVRGVPFSETPLQPNRLPDVTYVSRTGLYGFVTNTEATRVLLARLDETGPQRFRQFALPQDANSSRIDDIEKVELSANDSYLLVTTKSGRLAFAEVAAAFASQEKEKIVIDLTFLTPSGQESRSRPAYVVVDHPSAGESKGLMISIADGQGAIYDLADAGKPIPKQTDPGQVRAMATLLLSGQLPRMGLARPSIAQSSEPPPANQYDTQETELAALSISQSGATIGALVRDAGGSRLALLSVTSNFKSDIQKLCANAFPDVCGSNENRNQTVPDGASDEFRGRRFIKVGDVDGLGLLFLGYSQIFFGNDDVYGDKLVYLLGSGSRLFYDTGQNGREVKRNPNSSYSSGLFDDLTKQVLTLSSGPNEFSVYIINPFAGDLSARDAVYWQSFQGSLSSGFSWQSFDEGTNEESNPIKYDRIALTFADGSVASLSVEEAKYSSVLTRARNSLPKDRSITEEERILHGVPPEDRALGDSTNFQDRRALECPAMFTRLYVSSCDAIPGFSERACLAPMRVFGNRARQSAETIYRTRDPSFSSEAIKSQCKGNRLTQNVEAPS